MMMKVLGSKNLKTIFVLKLVSFSTIQNDADFSSKDGPQPPLLSKVNTAMRLPIQHERSGPSGAGGSVGDGAYRNGRSGGRGRGARGGGRGAAARPGDGADPARSLSPSSSHCSTEVRDVHHGLQEDVPAPRHRKVAAPSGPAPPVTLRLTSPPLAEARVHSAKGGHAARPWEGA
jgi:hypothetical protein